MAKVNSNLRTKKKIPAKTSGKKVVLKPTKKLKPQVLWQANKISQIRQVLEPIARRAGHFGALGGISILFILTLSAIFLPKNKYEQAKEDILKNPNNVEARLNLAEELLANNQIQEAGKELAKIEEINKEYLTQENDENKVLGLNNRLEQLKNDWQESNPEELKNLISKWNEVVSQTPTYRDGWIRLAYYHYRLGEKDEAKIALTKAIEIDPYFEKTKELQEAIN